MNYYEELGVSSNANIDEIRKAYRNLIRLVHPDLQTVPALREAAEIQMRRLSAMIHVLSDPEARRQYDASLGGHSAESIDAWINQRPATAPPVRAGSPAPAFRSSTNGFLITAISAVVLTSGTLWFFAGDLASLRQPPVKGIALTRREPVAPDREASRRPDAHPATRRPEASTTGANKRKPMREAIPLQRAGKRAAVEHTHESESVPEREPPVSRKPTGLSDTTAPAPRGDPPVTPELSLAGMWFYAAESVTTSSARAPFYVPEFIQMQVSVANDIIHGQYAARYRITDRLISSEVAFAFEGQMDAENSLPWRSADGSTGTIAFQQLKTQSVRVDWKTSTFGARLGLAAGSAVLIKGAKW